MKNNHYIKRLVACAIQFDKDFHEMEGGIPALDNITELILYINQTMDVSKKAKDELDDDVCSKTDTPDSKRSDTYNYNDLIFIIVSLNIYEIKNTVLTSSLVRLGKERKIKMKKLINWIWSKKQSEEVEVYEVRPHRMVDEMVREFNADHGLPLDQLVG